MSNTIKIKRSTGSTAPNPNLRQGEIAYAEGSKALYIGAGTEGSAPNYSASSMHIIGGAINNLIAPTGSLNMNSQKIVNLAAPTAANDAARKVDVDNAIQGIDVRESVRLVAVANVANYTTSSQSSALTIDSKTVAENDRILLTAQSTPSQNGIWKMTLTGGGQHLLVRASDAQNASDLSANMFFFVEEGTVYEDTGWVCTTNETVTMSNMAFSQFTGASGITAGSGLTKTGNTLSVDQVNLGTGVTGTLPDSGVQSSATWNAKQDALTFGAVVDGTSNIPTGNHVFDFVSAATIDGGTF